MKQAIMTLSLLVLMVLSVYSQNKADSVSKLKVPKSDTTYVAVPVYERYDTIKANIVYYGDLNGNVKFIRDGYVIVKGFAVQDNDKKWKWTDKPNLEGALDSKKKRLQNVLQVF